jgi:hypothetical protein
VGSGKKMMHPGFGFHLESKELEVMAGMFHFGKDQLQIYRSRVAGDEGKELSSILQKLAIKGYHLSEPAYKQVPREYPQDHPRGRLLKHKGLYVYADTLPPSIVQSKELIDIVLDRFREMAPVLTWLSKNVDS